MSDANKGRLKWPRVKLVILGFRTKIEIDQKRLAKCGFVYEEYIIIVRLKMLIGMNIRGL